MGPKMWARSGLRPILPPKYGRMPGRPKMVRVREPDEEPKNKTKLNMHKHQATAEDVAPLDTMPGLANSRDQCRKGPEKRYRVYLFSFSNSFLFYF